MNLKIFFCFRILLRQSENVSSFAMFFFFSKISFMIVSLPKSQTSSHPARAQALSVSHALFFDTTKLYKPFQWRIQGRDQEDPHPSLNLGKNRKKNRTGRASKTEPSLPLSSRSGSATALLLFAVFLARTRSPNLRTKTSCLELVPKVL